MNPLDYLFGLEFHGIKLGLDNITALLKSTGNPQNSYPTVHVGGTNGKGSTVAFLDHILREAGYRVGRFTSPHLISLNERFMVNGIPIDDSGLEGLIEVFRGRMDDLDLSPTFFEMNTAIAFQYFVDQEVDIALIEVGLGGRFDSTNVITPELSIVTNIDLEHTQFLGDTRAAIAFEKAGIIKEGIPVVFGNLNDEAAPVLRDAALQRNARILELSRDFDFAIKSTDSLLNYNGPIWQIDDIQLPLVGQHQAENASVALAAAELLSTRFTRLTPDCAETGLSSAHWPCRMEKVLESPEVIIDVAHNPAGVRTLINTIDHDVVLLLSVAADKEAASMISILSERAKHIVLTQFDNSRATDASDLAGHVPAHIPSTIEPDFNAAIDAGIRLARDTGTPLLITGSLFTAGQARAYLTEQYGAPAMRF